MAKNNSKAWFNDHRTEYEADLLDPAKAFVTAIGARLKKFAPRVNAIPSINGSIFRLNRDLRFSKSATPYKSHLGIFMWEGAGAKMESSGFYFHLEPPNLELGCGIYQFTKEQLERYREHVVHPRRGPALAKAIKSALSKGAYDVGGARRKRVPKPYDPNHPNANLLLHDGLWLGRSGLIPKELTSPKLLDLCEKAWKTMLPVHAWLLEVV